MVRSEEHDPETHLIPLVLEAAADERASVSIFGDDYDTADGTCIRDFVHVTDLAAAHVAALSVGRSGFSAYNLRYRRRVQHQGGHSPDKRSHGPANRGHDREAPGRKTRRCWLQSQRAPSQNCTGSQCIRISTTSF